MKKTAKMVLTTLLLMLMALTALPITALAANGAILLLPIKNLHYSPVQDTYLNAEGDDFGKFIKPSGAATSYKVAYCLNFNKGLSSSDFMTSANDFDKLSNDQKLLYMTALRFGFTDADIVIGSNGKIVFGEAEQLAYFATQVMIWNIAENIFDNAAIEAKVVAGFFTDAAKRSVYYGLKDKIIHELRVNPSFSYREKSEVVYNNLLFDPATGKYSVTLTDANSVIGDFTYVAVPGITATVDNNNLTIVSDTKLESGVILTFQKSFLGSALIWGTGNTKKQKVICFDNTNTCFYREVYVGIKSIEDTVLGTIEIAKTGERFASVSTTSDATYGNIYTPVYAAIPLSGVEFTIYAEENIVSKDGSTQYLAGDLVGTLTTGADGKALSGELLLGKYKVIETSTVPGYVLDPTPHIVELVEANAIANLVTETVQIANPRQKFNVTFEKFLKPGIGVTQAPYSEVIYGVYAADNLTAADSTIIPQNSLLELVSVNNSGLGTLSKDLPLGKYYLKELKTAPGYILDNTQHEFTLIYNTSGPIINLKVGAGAFINEIIVGSGKILKVDPSNKPLAGAVFKVFTSSDFYIGEFTTNSDGVILLENLTFGDYYVIETKAPAGLVLNSAKRYFSIANNGEVVQVVVVNNYTDIPRTGDLNNLNLWWWILGGSTLAWLAASFILMKRKSYASNNER